jgi:hypothetical protein
VSFVVGGCGLAEDGGVRNTRLNMLQNAARMLNDMPGAVCKCVEVQHHRGCRIEAVAVRIHRQQLLAWNQVLESAAASPAGLLVIPRSC